MTELTFCCWLFLHISCVMQRDGLLFLMMVILQCVSCKMCLHETCIFGTGVHIEKELILKNTSHWYSLLLVVVICLLHQLQLSPSEELMLLLLSLGAEVKCREFGWFDQKLWTICTKKMGFKSIRYSCFLDCSWVIMEQRTQRHTLSGRATAVYKQIWHRDIFVVHGLGW